MVQIADLQIDERIYNLVRDEIAPGTGIEVEDFFASLSEIIEKLGPKNKALLDERKRLDQAIDQYHLDRKSHAFDLEEYKTFLEEIGYLVPEGEDFQVTTANVDPELANLSGPQLVVPVTIDRYATNAANARWGSLYDALYGTDVITETGDLEKGTTYNTKRGEAVISYANAFLDDAVSLASGSYDEVKSLTLTNDKLAITLEDGTQTALADSRQFAGYTQQENRLTSVLLNNNGLHIELQINPEHPIGKQHKAGIKDVLLEAALTTIQDFEDAVSAVDAEDKARAYRNWCGLMKGTLTASFTKNNTTIDRSLNKDRSYTTPSGDTLTLPGRSVMLVRNVGIHMYTDAVTKNGESIPETFLDVMVSTLAALHDLKGANKGSNSKTGSMYIVKPKQHSPDEVAASVELFSKVEDALGLERNTLKIGIMDEEKRMSVNLKEAIRAASERVVFINTGFLDRTGDQISTDMEAGPVLTTAEIKSHAWLQTYENNNVKVGLETGLHNVGQIGKGMFPKTQAMAEMVEQKIGHPKAGANTAWVPSPTAATLHAMHYHKINVSELQKEMLSKKNQEDTNQILVPPLIDRDLSQEEKEKELRNNAQGILGYMVHWIDRGIGCSAVKDINDEYLMEDRATLRIKEELVANWLHHSVISFEEVKEIFTEMAAKVDKQNSDVLGYVKMTDNLDRNIAFNAALELVQRGVELPQGYVEPILHEARLKVKTAAT